MGVKRTSLKEAHVVETSTNTNWNNGTLITIITIYSYKIKNKSPKRYW